MNAVIKNRTARRTARKPARNGKLQAAVKQALTAPPPPPQLDPIRILHRGVLIQPLLDQLEAHPDLWNENAFRTDGAYTGNPHQRIDDIIVRFRDWKYWKGNRRSFVDEPHDSVWWGPCLKLPALKPLVFDLMRWMYGTQLGMVLITRIPPMTNVGKHIDLGWHAEHYLKFAVQLKAVPGQKFCYDSMEIETAPGDLYAFDNSLTHWVENPTGHERITLIICMRLENHICMNYKWKGD